MNDKFTITQKLAVSGWTIALAIVLLTGCQEEQITPGDRLNGVELSRGSTSAGMGMTKFSAHLVAREETTVVLSKATGEAKFTLSADGTTLHYKLYVANIENVTQAHIHCGNRGVAGPPIAFLFGLDPNGVTVNGLLAEGTITSADVIVQPDTQACTGGVATFEQLLQKIMAGETYVNVHTTAYPGGEIRGQIR